MLFSGTKRSDFLLERCDVLIVGGGIVGCSIASDLCKYNLNIVLMEKENDVSMGTTRSNTAIIHSGYDPEPGTKMARMNVRGAQMTGDICSRLGVPYSPIGSMVVSVGREEDEQIKKLYERGIKNHVEGMSLLWGDEVRKVEPGISEDITGALLAPSAAVIEPMRYCIALGRNACSNGVKFVFSSPVTSISKKDGEYCINGEYMAKAVVNCGGIFGDVISDMVGEHHVIKPVAGEYYLMDKDEGDRVSHIIFPCPSKSGKGVVCTPTVHGNLLVGPTAQERISPEDTSVTSQGLVEIRDKIKKTVPGINFSKAIRNFAGLRAYSESDDFIVGQGEKNRGFYEAIGIKSPGLSSAPAIAQEISQMVAEYLGADENKNYRDYKYQSPFIRAGLKERGEMIRKNPAYGEIVCRCEMITRGEMEDQMKFPLPPTTLDGMKRRVGSGMGRCQGGFCSVKVHALISEMSGIPMEDVKKDGDGSQIIIGGKL